MNETPEEILDKVWSFLRCRTPKPQAGLVHQRRTGKFWTRENRITIREDSWNKMHPAERRLIVTHEAVHSCKVGHQAGFRTSFDILSLRLYERIWGKDQVYDDFMGLLDKTIKRILAGRETQE